MRQCQHKLMLIYHFRDLRTMSGTGYCPKQVTQNNTFLTGKLELELPIGFSHIRLEWVIVPGYIFFTGKRNWSFQKQFL